jgi:hypothetical protein
MRLHSRILCASFEKSVAEVIVAPAGAMLIKSPQLVAIDGAAKAIEPASDSASRTKRGKMRRMVSPPLFVAKEPLSGAVTLFVAVLKDTRQTHPARLETLAQGRKAW